MLIFYGKQKFVWFCCLVVFISPLLLIKRATCFMCFLLLKMTLIKPF